MRLYYLSNSSYAIFLSGMLLVFDYYKNTSSYEEKGVSSGVIGRKDLEEKEHVYVFASHSHSDHFNTSVFDWRQYNKNINYMLDEGIKKARRFLGEANISFFKKGTEFYKKDIFIKAFGSTDAGVSFYIEAEGKKIFHAGDLNCWHWEDEASPEYSLKARQNFHAEIEDIKQFVSEVDLAFFPVDIRLGSKHDEGAKYFIKELKPKVLIPMHTERMDVLKRFKEENSSEGTKIVCPVKLGDKILLD